jgi:hypothetical protein
MNETIIRMILFENKKIAVVNSYKATLYPCIIHVTKVQYSVNFSCRTSSPMEKLLLLLSQFYKQRPLHCLNIDPLL